MLLVANNTDTVRCLACGAVYVKPLRGDISARNPGCPDCGYVGWQSANAPFTPLRARRRSAGGLRPRQSALPG